MEFKGTKGKWEIRPTMAQNKNNKPLFYDIVIDDTSFISTHKNRYLDIDDEEQLANAKLIAAAPELLETVNELLELLSFHGYNQSTEINYAKQLIKKATE